MTHQDRARLKTNEMLEQIAAYFRTRFRENPELNEIRFSSTHALCSALNKAGVSLWIFSDSGISVKLNQSCKQGGLVRGFLHKGEWTFYRHDYFLMVDDNAHTLL